MSDNNKNNDETSEPQNNSEDNLKKDNPLQSEEEVNKDKNADADKEKEISDSEGNAIDETKIEPKEEAKQEDKQPVEEEYNEITGQEKPVSSIKKKPAESNYQVSLIDENLLKIKVNTDQNVDISYDNGKGSANKFSIPPSGDNKKQEIEIVISINSSQVNVSPVGNKEESTVQVNESTENSSGLTPNPVVSSLIGEKTLEQREEAEMTEDEILHEKLNRKNPYNLFRKAYQRNFTRATISAVIIYLIAVSIFSAYAAKQKTPQSEPLQQRLVVIQDMPEPKINLENIQDPNLPPEEENANEEEGVIPRKIENRTKAPRVFRPRTEDNTPEFNTSDSSLTEEQLDSIRNAAKNDSLNNEGIDSNLANSNIPDSLRASYAPNEVGLSLDYPKNWKLIDNRDVDKNKKEFDGLILTDTTVKQGTIQLFLLLDANASQYSDEFKNIFPINDTSSNAFYIEPRTIAGVTEYRFYIFGKTDKLSIRASVRKDVFEQYKGLIEGVVKSIRLKRPGT